MTDHDPLAERLRQVELRVAELVAEVRPAIRLVYGLVGLVMVAFVGALAALVFR